MSSEQSIPFIFLAATSFDSLLSGRTRRLAEALAARGHRVTFVELPSARNAARSPLRFGPRELAGSGIRVVRICPIPLRGRLAGTAVERQWAAFTARCLRRWIPELASGALITSTPWWSEVTARLPRRLSCYDYIDHLSVQAGPGRARLFAKWDVDLLGQCDLVATVSRPLLRHLEAQFTRGPIFLIPNGVQANWLDAPTKPVARASLTPRPERPLAGFLGSLYEWIDVELLIEAARARPGIEFVLVGPQRRGVKIDELLALPNVHWRPPVPFEQVPRVVRAFDVCLIPFKRDIIAEFADPLKLYEYCALGRPVVTTVEFQAEGPPPPAVVAPDAARFAAAVEAAAHGDSPQHQRDRVDFARRHTWEQRAEAFVAAVRSLR